MYSSHGVHNPTSTVQPFHLPSLPGRVAQLEEVEGQWEAKKNAMTTELERVENLLAAAYDRSAAALRLSGESWVDFRNWCMGHTMDPYIHAPTAYYTRIETLSLLIHVSRKWICTPCWVPSAGRDPLSGTFSCQISMEGGG